MYTTAEIAPPAAEKKPPMKRARREALAGSGSQR
jgi:hypothetical protein